MKKILLINDHSTFGGGGDTALFQEKEILLQNSYEVYTLAFDKEPINDEYIISFTESKNSKITKLRKFFGSATIDDFILKAIDKIQPDIVHCHLISKYPTSVFKALKGRKTITTLHGPNFFCTSSWGGLKNGSACEQGIGLKCFTRGCASLTTTMLYSYMSHKVWKDLSNNTSLFHCPSRNIYNTAKRLGLKNLIYKPLGIDIQFEQPVFKEHNARPILLFVGAIAEVKGIKILLESMVGIVKAIPNVLLKIAGRGVLSNWVKEYIYEHSLEDNVEVLGFVPHAKVRELYIEANIFLMPSIWQEQFGLVGTEALACETPCIASSVGGIPEWLQHNQSGFLVPPHGVKELTEATIKLLNSPELQRSFGKYGREFVLTQYSSSNYKKNILEMIDKVTE